MIKILDIKVDHLNYNQTLDQIQKFILSKKPHQIVTVNPEFIISAQKDMEIKKILNSADLTTPDGIGIIWASKILKNPLEQRITGTDLVWKISELAHQHKYSIYFVGAKEGIAKKTSENLKAKYTNLKVAGAESSSPQDNELVERIRKTKPDILFVAFGHPKQERWIFQNKNMLNVPVMIGVGGAFDYISGQIKRAPSWIRNIGFEWLYRLIKEPKRIKRQIMLPKFVALVLLSLAKK
ncbi:MAG: WecB/TagA/CpsF family glycosyltransferase [Candidatus Berkelbacteria bacterium]|nr:WecB/TagA/CpsF family glycosyltransferase [Candidatus Berkelbacteria bacterium]